MFDEAQDVPFGLGLAGQIAAHDFAFAEDLHGIELLVRLALDQLDLAETAFAQYGVSHEVFRGGLLDVLQPDEFGVFVLADFD